jgi:hypothetical protein
LAGFFGKLSRISMGCGFRKCTLEGIWSALKIKRTIRWKCGGGAALAADNTNVLLSSTRIEALGLAAGMSHARNWEGNKVCIDWYIDYMGSDKQLPQDAQVGC